MGEARVQARVREASAFGSVPWPSPRGVSGQGDGSLGQGLCYRKGRLPSLQPQADARRPDLEPQAQTHAVSLLSARAVLDPGRQG